MSDPVEDAPVSRFVDHVLQSVIGRGAEKIHFERQKKTFGNGGIFGVMMEIDGTRIEVAQPPYVLWEPVISRLKVLARMVDYGPNRSDVGEFTVRLKDGRSADIQMTSNPNPHTDSKLTLINMSVADVASEEYKALKDTFLNAAMPTDQTQIEHTFGWFLRQFAGHFEDRLVRRISNEGMIALRQASLDEIHDKDGERTKFAEAIELMTEQTSVNDFAAAGKTITEAYEELYGSRQLRYETILSDLTDIDRAAVKSEFLDKVSLNIEPSRSRPGHQEVVLAIEFPGEDTRRIERRWSYFLANGMPMTEGEDISYGDVTACSGNFSSRGD